ncbi:MAG: EAL domain-containing protein [Planctomycetota bacterium]|nr:EAL domain-containing protein [Planctomycetota bacterium]
MSNASHFLPSTHFFGLDAPAEKQVEHESKIVLDSAYQGEDGLRKVVAAVECGEPYALAFVDMRMPPGWDGLQTIEEMWKVAPEMQVVICTAFSPNTWDEIVDRVGNSDRLLILKKPVDQIEVRQLAAALTQRWSNEHQARLRQEDLEQLLLERTQELQHVSSHDQLTQLPNRSQFQLELNSVLQDPQRDMVGCVCMLDLDHFQKINDQFGHSVGDELLRSAAARMLSQLDDSATVYRLGGDEFAVLWCRGAGEDPSFVEFLPDKLTQLHASLRAPYDVGGQQLFCTSSIGVAFIPEDGKSAEDFWHKADLALFMAKKDGRDQVREFITRQEQSVCTLRELVADLEEVLSKDEFLLRYQPVVNTQTKRVESFEALLRWNHPVHGIVEPLEFLSAAENQGLIINIGEWVLQQACRDASEWPADVSLAVNVSPIQFRSSNLDSTILNAITKHGISPDRLEIEFKENALLKDEKDIESCLEVLRELGVRIVLDDFGTGQSSLSYVRKLRFHKVKLDHEIVGEALKSDDAQLILKAVAGLGRSMGIETTAEGI